MNIAGANKVIKQLLYENRLIDCNDEIILGAPSLSPTNLYENHSVEINGIKKFFIRKAILKNEIFPYELAVARKMGEYGLAPKVIFSDPGKQLFIMEYCECLDIKNSLKEVASSLRRFHLASSPYETNINSIKERFWFEKYYKLPDRMMKDFHLAFDMIKHQSKFYNDCDIVFSHNDLHWSNILVGTDICFIDFDHVGPNTKYFDLATISMSLNLDSSEDLILMENYHGNIPYDLEAFEQQKRVVMARYAISTVALISNPALFLGENISTCEPFSWKCNDYDELDYCRYKLAYNFLNKFSELNEVVN